MSSASSSAMKALVSMKNVIGRLFGAVVLHRAARSPGGDRLTSKGEIDGRGAPTSLSEVGFNEAPDVRADAQAETLGAFLGGAFEAPGQEQLQSFFRDRHRLPAYYADAHNIYIIMLIPTRWGHRDRRFRRLFTNGLRCTALRRYGRTVRRKDGRTLRLRVGKEVTERSRCVPKPCG